MSKKNKNFNRFESLEIQNMDELGYMTDDALFDRTQKLTNERNKLASAGRDCLAWEVELAYLQREGQLRSARLEAHAEYCKKFVVNQETEETSSEEQVVEKE